MYNYQIKKKGNNYRIYLITIGITIILFFTFFGILYYSGIIPKTLPYYIKESIDFYKNIKCNHILNYYINNDYNYSFNKLKQKHFDINLTEFITYEQKFKNKKEITGIRNKILALRIKKCILEYIKERDEFYKNLQCTNILKSASEVIGKTGSIKGDALKKEIQKIFSRKQNFEDPSIVFDLDKGGSLKDEPKLLWTDSLKDKYSKKVENCHKTFREFY
jgi:hypothetical protein